MRSPVPRPGLPGLGPSFLTCSARALRQRPQTLSNCPRRCLNDPVQFHAPLCGLPPEDDTRGWRAAHVRPPHRHPRRPGPAWRERTPGETAPRVMPMRFSFLLVFQWVDTRNCISFGRTTERSDVYVTDGVTPRKVRVTTSCTMFLPLRLTAHRSEPLNPVPFFTPPPTPRRPATL